VTLKDDQIAALVKFLEAEEREEQTTEEVAEDIIDAFYGLLNKSLKNQPPILHVGEPFKHAVTGKVHYVAWAEDDLYWVTTGDSRYGYLGPIEPWQKYASESRAKTGGPGKNAKGWEVGDKLTFLRQKKPFTVLAVIDKAVLIRDPDAKRPIVEPNDSLEKFYKKQVASLF
jgi:hypothetical protein